MTKDKVSYSLSTINAPDINGIRELSKEDFDKYSGYISTLTKLSSDENLFRIVELNYADLKNKMDSYLKDYETSPDAGFEEFGHLMLNANRLILNFLSAVRTYLDHTETRLKREFGENSEEYKTFKTETSTAYDNNFSYRFLYKLRNFSQHCGLPTGSIHHNSTGDENGKTINTLTLSLVRDELLSKFDSWGTVKKELEQQDKTFDIIPLLESKAQILKEINEKINKPIYQRHQQAGHELMSLMFESQKVRGIPCLICATGTAENLKLTMQWFPYAPISKITGVKIDVRHVGEKPSDWAD